MAELRRDGGELELRVVVPRTALEQPPRPEYFSQHNAPELLGLPRRQFLELLRRPDAPAVTRVGKTRLVEREAMLAFLRALRDREREQVARVDQGGAGDELDGPGRVLAEIGCVDTGRRQVG